MEMLIICVIFSAIQIADNIKPPELLLSISEKQTTYGSAAVVTNSEVCTNAALEILSEDGSAADAMITALLCEGITNPQSMGVGGGFIATVYSSAAGKAEVLNAREAAPAGASKNMFGPASDLDIASSGLSIGIPGELKGYWTLHQKYGLSSWYDLFRPAIDLCRNGIPVLPYTGKMIAKVKEEVMQSPTIKELLINPATKELYKEGETMYRFQLAETLEAIAKHGPGILYDGKLTPDFIEDIKEYGGIITRSDLINYKPVWQKPVERRYGKNKLFTAPPPASGNLLVLILDVMNAKLCKSNDRHLDDLFWHRLVETWKFAYGIRGKMTGPCVDKPSSTPNFQEEVNVILKKMRDCNVSSNVADYYFGATNISEDHGTSNLVVIAPNGDAIAATSTINLSFGAMFMSQSTGIILNNEMIDFSIPHHYTFKGNLGANFIAPNRQPMSSMVPTVVVDADTGNVRVVIGSAGGFKILTSTSSVLLQHLFLGIDFDTALQHKRLHNQLVPLVLEYEEGFPEEILESLSQKGHLLQMLEAASKENSSASMAMHSGVTGISVINGQLVAVGDNRRKSFAGGY